MVNKSMYHIVTTILLMFVSALFYTGCNTYDADFERGNPKDPKSPNFVHTMPSGFTVAVEDGVIDIGWVDKTEYNDGYLVEKAINDSTQFEEFNTLPGDAEGFSDDSRKIGQDIYYRVSSFEIKDGDKNIVHSEILSISFELIQWKSFYSDINNIELRWDSSIDFVDGFRIEEKSPADSTYTLIEDLNDISEPEQVYQYNYTTDLQSFQAEVRIVAYQYHDELMVDIHSVKETLFINSITSLEVTFKTETETLIEWGGIVDFVDHYLLELSRGGEKVAQWEMPPTGSFLLEMPQIPGRTLYSVKGFHEGIEGRYHNRIASFPNIRPQISITSSSLDELNVSWEGSSPSYYEDGIKPTQFTVERRTNNFDFEEIAVLPGDHFSYDDTNLDPGSTYTYRVKTLTSTPSGSITVENKNLYTVTSVRGLPLYFNQFNPVNFQFIDNNKLAVHGRHNTPYPVTLIDTGEMTVINQFNSGNDANAFLLSPDGKRVVEIVKGNTVGGYDMNIWNVETNSLEHVIQDIVINTETMYSGSITRYSPSGDLIAVGEIYTETEVSFWNPDNGEFVNSIEIPGKDLTSFYFNSLANEFFVVIGDEILVYDLHSFELTRQIPVSINITYNSQVLFSESENYMFISAGNSNLYKVDIETWEVLNEIAFGNSIEFVSANKQLSEIWVHTFSRNILIDTDSFEILQDHRWSHFLDRLYLSMNKFQDNTAVTFERKYEDDQWFMKKWERLPHWHETDPYGE